MTDMWRNEITDEQYYRWMDRVLMSPLQRARKLRVDRIVRRDQRRRNRQAMHPLKWTGRDVIAIRKQAHTDWLLMKDLWD